MNRPSLQFKTLHYFKGKPDGASPYAPLLYFNGAFYGTTVFGGAYNAGTVFRMTRSGDEQIIHSFGSSGDGSQPYGGLIVVGRRLYGTTRLGGPYGNGTFFSMTLSGSEHIIHGFQSRDGIEPEAAPVAFNGAFYLTTIYGGAYDFGTVFRTTPSGEWKTLYSFGAGTQDGLYPNSNLLVLEGALYGATINGGKSASCGQGCGTIFKVDLSGKETVVYNFGGLNYSDGYYPDGALIAVRNLLYGTTLYGGPRGYGAVFAVSKSGQENIVYSFGDLNGGTYPYGGVTYVNGNFYGTTQMGGATRDDGTVFKTTPSGAGGTLYDFNGGDGASPYAALTNVDGVLYGTTYAGGKHFAGTVFRISP